MVPTTDGKGAYKLVIRIKYVLWQPIQFLLVTSVFIYACDKNTSNINISKNGDMNKMNRAPAHRIRVQRPQWEDGARINLLR